MKLVLNGLWNVSYEQETTGRDRQEIAFTVPGNLESALAAAGKAPAPYYGLNAQAFRPYEFYRWTFRRTFECATVPRRCELVLERIEPESEIYLNGELLGRADNGLVEHRFDCSKQLRAGQNELLVRMGSCVNAQRRRKLDPACYSAYPFNYEVMWCRKGAHCWGWDIAPRLALGGIWGEVYVEEIAEHRFTDIYIQTMKLEAGRAKLGVHYNFETALPDFSGLELQIDGRCGDSVFSSRTDVWLNMGFVGLTVDQPRLWQVRNYGAPWLYDVTLTLLHHGRPLAETRTRVGIRTLELRREDVECVPGENAFAFVVNGQTIHIQGTNHVPLDALHSRDRDRLPEFLKMLRDLNCNMVRVWGGGVYESDAFYDFCDAEGILVWQDFMLGCAVYSTDDEFCDMVRKEAELVVRRLRQHPALALWAGDNECDIFALAAELGLKPENIRVTRETLPEVLKRLDPMRPYLPSSPYFGSEAVRRDPEGGQTACPEKHLWGPRNYFRAQYYSCPDASFVSEIGYHGCPAVNSIKQFIPPEQLWPWQNNAAWDYHASNPYYGSNAMLNYRTGLMANQIREMFGFIPDTLEEFARLSQIVQAEAKKFFIETARINRPRQSGILWWNLLDCWPQFSDAVVDYYFNRKLAYFYIRRVQQPTCLMIGEPQGWEQGIFLDNASGRVECGRWRVTDAENGRELAAGEFNLMPNEVCRVGRLKLSLSSHMLLLLEWDTQTGLHGVNHYLCGFPPFDAARYQSWDMERIAALDRSFIPAEIAR